MSAVDELKKDFEDSMSAIDFKKYDPYSRAFMKALFIGQMYMAVKCLEDDSDIEEELDGAKKYFDTFRSTGDTAYRDMANDELRHAGILIKKHMAKATNQDEKTALSKIEAERQKLQAHFASHSSATET